MLTVGAVALGRGNQHSWEKPFQKEKPRKKKIIKQVGMQKATSQKFKAKEGKKIANNMQKKIALIYDVKMSSIPKQSEKAMHSGYVTPVSLHKMALRTQRHTESKTTFTKTLFIANDLVSSIIYS